MRSFAIEQAELPGKTAATPPKRIRAAAQKPAGQRTIEEKSSNKSVRMAFSPQERISSSSVPQYQDNHYWHLSNLPNSGVSLL